MATTGRRSRRGVSCSGRRINRAASCCSPKTPAACTLYADVSDTHRTRADTGDANALAADHLILSLGNAVGRRRYLLASAAPGSLIARPLDSSVDGLPEQLTAQWQEDGSGYQVELQLPRSLALRSIGMSVYDASLGGDPMAVDARPLLMFSPALSNELAQLAPERVQARVLNPQGWLLARSGRLNHRAGRRRPTGVVRIDGLSLVAGHASGRRQPLVAGRAATGYIRSECRRATASR
jgi:hypothetical protein